MIKPAHFNEWLSSAVHPDIIELNVESLSGDAALERLTENAIESIGKDQKVPHSYQYATAPVAKILNRYSDMSSEGWWASGIDVLIGQPSQWGCFKPDRPRLSQEKLKPIKYEHPAKCPTEIFALRVSYRIGLKIAEKQGLKDDYLARLGDNSLDTEDREFWKWAIERPSIALLITEGAKKAGSLLTAGYVAIALPGIFNGYRQPKDEMGLPTGPAQLIPQLEAFSQSGREVIFAFDQDEKPKTVKNVQIAIQKTGKLLEDRGCKVSIIRWDKSHKGVDDFIF